MKLTRRNAMQAALAGALLGRSAVSSAIDVDTQRKVDDAIVRALDFLASAQLPEGAWRADSYGECTAATSLACMAYMAAGHIPGEGPYGDIINKGIRWVISRQEDNGMLIAKRSHGPMYAHGISTLMLAEAIGMVDEAQAKLLKRSLELAIRLILESQAYEKDKRHAGGWRYQVDSRDSDLSVTGWQVMSLRAAKDVGCDVPADAIDKAIEYVKHCSTPDKRGFGYQPGSGATPTLTGVGISCLEVCGAHDTEEARGAADWLKTHPIRIDTNYCFYGVYYTGVGLFKLGGEHAEQSHANICKLLLPIQSADGAWTPEHGSERGAGKSYATALAILGLAIEYRYLPIYQR
jgi:hypothetical protein